MSGFVIVLAVLPRTSLPGPPLVMVLAAGAVPWPRTPLNRVTLLLMLKALAPLPVSTRPVKIRSPVPGAPMVTGLEASSMLFVTVRVLASAERKVVFAFWNRNTPPRAVSLAMAIVPAWRRVAARPNEPFAPETVEQIGG